MIGRVTINVTLHIVYITVRIKKFSVVKKKMDNKNSTQEIEFQFDKLNVSGYNCSRCNKQFTEELWCKDCDPFRIIEGWTSGNSNIDKFIKDTMYHAKHKIHAYPKFLEWVPFDRFTNLKLIGYAWILCFA